MSAAAPNAAAAPLGGRATINRSAALALLAVTQFVLVLDAGIVGVALPSLVKGLGFQQADLSWVTNAYTLMFGGFLLLGGRLADYLGRRRMFMGGLILFSVASLAGSLSPDPGFLIGARAVQGFAAAVVSPAALSLLLISFPDNTDAEKAQRNKALGVWGAVAGAGGAVGLILGGMLTDWFGWQACFWVNVPIGVLAALLAPRILPEGAPSGERNGFDLAGAFTVTAGLAGIVFVLVNAQKVGWGSPETLGLGAAGVALLIAFVVIEGRTKQPLVPLSIFRRPVLRGANVASLLQVMGLMPAFFFMTLYTQQVLGYSPLKSGMSLVPIAVAIMVAATAAGQLVAKVGIKLTTVGGMVVMAAGLLWVSGMPADGSYVTDLLLPQIVIGLGGGMAWVALTVAGTAGASEAESGLASGLLNTAQQIGGALGLAILAAVASARTSHLFGTGDNAAQALSGGFGTALLAGAGLGVLGAVATVFLLPGKNAMPAVDEHAIELAEETDHVAILPVHEGRAPETVSAN
ncbi:drug resistance transporter, EmrB/QacA subfamily [Catenulispora acidiphila DSM 44928]|uniref:Drug resistance transporter, EmrB/QacA subfamily n=1 Tax=Catenulispora acidiphila (strain DSM 44928 / JCM 14897 / NBRC 102108 / NRRL B-24433 / ID139908) TaxID=479433 RepID=C7Q1F6_CATAD|nr:MFS transporter [Catenulispora acidiphila]ACU73685.1 drug resistance transporter, EmrB/QacA subfamily [Catenulispora acidiphila DSM 44928]